MKRAVTIIDAINDRHLFAPWFKDRATWAPWFVFLAALFALPMDEEQLAIYRRCTGRTTVPSSPGEKRQLIKQDGNGRVAARCLERRGVHLDAHAVRCLSRVLPRLPSVFAAWRARHSEGRLAGLRKASGQEFHTCADRVGASDRG